MSYAYQGTARTVRGTAPTYSAYAATPSYAGPARSAATTVLNKPATTYAPAAMQSLQAARPVTYAPSNIVSSPTRSTRAAVSSAGLSTIGTTVGATGLSTYGTTVGTAGLTTLGTSRIGTMTVGQGQRVISGNQVIGGNQVITGGRPATYIGGTGLTTASANLLAAGPIVSERVLSMPEAYASGFVRSEGPFVGATQPAMEVQVIGGGIQPVQMAEVEMLQQPAVVQQMVAEQQVVIEQQQPAVMQVIEQQPVMMQQQPVEYAQQVPVEEQQQVDAAQAVGAPRVVIVCTSANALGDHPTGVWSEELTGPYYVFREAGCEVYIASTQGGEIPLDANSLAEGTYTENDRRFQEEGGLELLAQSFPISDVRAEDIDCVWLAGGHGTVVDFEAALAQFITDAVAYGRPVGAVCHGVCGLLSAINQDGTPLLQGRQVTGFSNAEEDLVGLSDKVPYMVQTRMQELGAVYSCGEPWSDYALADGPIITGQNPQSSVRAAQLCIQAMTPQQ